jgi:hypothetical protein
VWMRSASPRDGASGPLQESRSSAGESKLVRFFVITVFACAALAWVVSLVERFK